MVDYTLFADQEEWVVWNGDHGLVTTATIGRIEDANRGRIAWLDEPFDMVGPFSLDELETHGRIAFAACIVMSRRKWQDDQVELRRESLEKRRATARRINEEFERRYADHGRRQAIRKPSDDRQHREALNLPVDGQLDSSQIKAAFRRLAQKVHPDVGGSNEQFIRITEARNALLAYVS
ncbi:DnaJ domain-containing protein [Methylomonas sp. MgM2]